VCAGTLLHSEQQGDRPHLASPTAATRPAPVQSARGTHVSPPAGSSRCRSAGCQGHMNTARLVIGRHLSPHESRVQDAFDDGRALSITSSLPNVDPRLRVLHLEQEVEALPVDRRCQLTRQLPPQRSALVALLRREQGVVNAPLLRLVLVARLVRYLKDQPLRT